jgi:large subunit ribosomal protein L23
MFTIIPRATEKTYSAQTQNTYVFQVPKSATKQSVAAEVEQQYKVTVEDVRILNRKGKPTKFSRGRHAYPGSTFRQDKKYAYVTLKSGDKIKVFDEEPVETEKAQEAKTTAVKAANETQNAEVKKAGLFTRRRTGNRGDK